MNNIIKTRIESYTEILNKLDEFDPNYESIKFCELRIFLVDKIKYNELLGQIVHMNSIDSIRNKAEETIGKKLSKTEIEYLANEMILDDDKIN